MTELQKHLIGMFLATIVLLLVGYFGSWVFAAVLWIPAVIIEIVYWTKKRK